MSDSIRVLLVAAANAMSGGGEKHIADLMNCLPAVGIEVALACPEGGDLSAYADSLGVPRYPVPIASGASAAKFADVRRAVEFTRPDLIHAHGSRAALFTRVADKMPAKRVVYTVHGIHVDHAGSLARKTAFLALERLQVRRTAHFITVCGSDVGKGTRLGILDPARTSVVRNGIEMPASLPDRGAFRAELGISADTPLVLSIGRFHEQKNQVALVRSWRAVLDREPEAVLVLVGAGQMEHELREAAVAYGLGDGLRFISPRTELGPIYADSDIFVLSSLWEGLPYVVLEAMAHSLPVVATDVDGIPEAVVDGETGLLVDPFDPTALADAVSALIAAPSLRASLGAAGRNRVEQEFSLDLMIDKTAAVYRKVAENL